MAEYIAQQVSVVNGSNAVIIESGESPEAVRQGDFLFITGSDPVGINRTYINSNSQHVIELSKNWSNGNKSNQPAIVLPTTVEFKSAAAALKNANLLVNDNFVAMQDWQTKTGTVTFVNIDGTTTTVKTLKQIESEAQAQLDTYHPFPWAMRKVEFEARRAANNEKFAASGFVHFGKHRVDSDNYELINEGLYTHLGLDGTLQVGASTNKAGKSKADFPVINITGVLSPITSLGDANYSRIKFPPAEDGTRTYNKESGMSATHASPAIAFASETETNKVVTNRVDIWGFEAFLREIHDGDPFVYASGLIQSQATSIDGVPTTLDNVRPVTYFSWYKGDLESVGKGVNWQTASELERIAIASNPDNNIYFNDETGKFYQWCIRGRSVAGVGNGDWDTIDTNQPASLTLRQQPVGTEQRTPPQGILNEALATGGGSNYYSNTQSEYNTDPRKGVFTSRRSDVSSEGYAYFLVCGTVNRLNRGAYHPSFNPLGTSGFGTAEYTSWAVKWHSQSPIRIASSTADCFITYSDGGSRSDNLNSGGSLEGESENTHPEGHFYDLIYASGYGGVCRDIRYPATPVTVIDAENKDINIKQGKSRGVEQVPFTFIARHTYASGSKHYVNRNYGGRSLEVGDSILFKDLVSQVWERRLITAIDDNQAKFLEQAPLTLVNDEIIVWETRTDITSISGEYTHLDVICDPENLVDIPQFSNGWLGSWIPVVPSGQAQNYPLSKISREPEVVRIYSDNNGASWIRDTVSINSIENLRSENWQSNRIGLYYYKANAKLTTPTMTAEILGGAKGLGAFYATSRGNTYSSGRELGHSFTNQACNGNNGIRQQADNMVSLGLRVDINLLSSDGLSQPPTHPPVVLDALAGQIAYKCQYYLVEKDSMLYLNYIYKGLYFTNLEQGWGDAGYFDVLPYQELTLNDNGHYVLAGTSQYSEPLGWIKNAK
tara:strand:+ start:12264 stop:15104 length:2841 start_codon:yes stop_codon:yes gene_type:complete